MVAVAGVVLCCVTLWKLLAVLFIVMVSVADVVLGHEVLLVCWQCSVIVCSVVGPVDRVVYCFIGCCWCSAMLCCVVGHYYSVVIQSVVL